MYRIFDAHCDTLNKLTAKDETLENSSGMVSAPMMKEYEGYIQIFAAWVDRSKTDNPLLSALMQESCQPEKQQTASRRQDLTKVRNYLDEHFTEKITLDELSDSFFINKFYLVRLFKEQYGQSINHYLQQIRITKAKQLLRFTDKTVEQIGLECGLGAHSYFTRTFKKVEGITPSEFRSQWLL